MNKKNLVLILCCLQSYVIQTSWNEFKQDLREIKTEFKSDWQGFKARIQFALLDEQAQEQRKEKAFKILSWYRKEKKLSFVRAYIRQKQALKRASSLQQNKCNSPLELDDFPSTLLIPAPSSTPINDPLEKIQDPLDMSSQLFNDESEYNSKEIHTPRNNSTPHLSDISDDDGFYIPNPSEKTRRLLRDKK